MKLYNPAVGLKWGKLEVTRVESELRSISTDDGVTETYMGYRCMLMCSCGKEWELWSEEIDKRILKSCDKCAVGKADVVGAWIGRPRSVKGPGIVKQIYMPVRLAEELQRLADKKGMSLSGLTVTLIETSLMDIEKQEKENA